MAYTARYVNPRFTLEHRVYIGMILKTTNKIIIIFLNIKK